MIGLARPLPALFGLPEQAWRSPDAMSAAIVAAREAGLEVGLLRAERGLRRPEDVRAVARGPAHRPRDARDPDLTAGSRLCRRAAWQAQTLERSSRWRWVSDWGTRT